MEKRTLTEKYIGERTESGKKRTHEIKMRRNKIMIEKGLGRRDKKGKNFGERFL